MLDLVNVKPGGGWVGRRDHESHGGGGEGKRDELHVFCPKISLSKYIKITAGFQKCPKITESFIKLFKTALLNQLPDISEKHLRHIARPTQCHVQASLLLGHLKGRVFIHHSSQHISEKNFIKLYRATCNCFVNCTYPIFIGWIFQQLC